MKSRKVVDGCYKRNKYTNGMVESSSEYSKKININVNEKDKCERILFAGGIMTKLTLNYLNNIFHLYPRGLLKFYTLEILNPTFYFINIFLIFLLQKKRKH